jgi:hypothetical protein
MSVTGKKLLWIVAGSAAVVYASKRALKALNRNGRLTRLFGDTAEKIDSATVPDEPFDSTEERLQACVKGYRAVLAEAARLLSLLEKALAQDDPVAALALANRIREFMRSMAALSDKEMAAFSEKAIEALSEEKLKPKS